LELFFGNPSKSDKENLFTAPELVNKIVNSVVIFKSDQEDSAKITSRQGPGKNNAQNADNSIRDVYVKKMIVNGGEIFYNDHSKEKDFEIALKEVSLDVDNLSYPLKDIKTDVFLGALFESEDLPVASGKVISAGWINAHKRDMDEEIKIVDEQGNPFMTAKLNAKNDHLKVKGQINLKRGLLGSIKNDDASSIPHLISNFLEASNVNVMADFGFETRLTEFKIENVSFSGSVLTK